jgi:hypothetical protein
LDKLKLEFKAEPPFLEMKMDHFEGDILQYSIDVFTAFKNMIVAMAEMVLDKLPGILSQA